MSDTTQAKNEKIESKSIEKDGKKIAWEVFVKKSGRLVKLITDETEVALTDDIKIVDCRCIPPCVETLILPKSVRRVHTDFLNPRCSQSVFETLKAFRPDPEIVKAKAKKEKIARISAIGAQALASIAVAELPCKTKTEPITKPRIGTLVTVFLPFGYKLGCLIPKRLKKNETPLVDALFAALKTPLDTSRGIDGQFDYLETLWEAGKAYGKAMKLSLNTTVHGDFSDSELQHFFQRILSPLDCTVSVEGNAVKIRAGHYLLLLQKKSLQVARVNTTISLGMPEQYKWCEVVQSAVNGESRAHILQQQAHIPNIFRFRVIDEDAWQFSPPKKERPQFSLDTLKIPAGDVPTESLLSQAFDGWRWSVDVADAKSPARRIIRVGLPFDAAFIFNLSTGDAEQNAQAKTVLAVMSALKTVAHDEQMLFEAVRQFSVQTPVTVKTKSGIQRSLMEFSGFVLWQDYSANVPFASEGQPPRAFVENDIMSYFAGSRMQVQIFLENESSYFGSYRTWNCSISIQTGEKIISLYCHSWRIFATDKSAWFCRSDFEKLIAEIEIKRGEDVQLSTTVQEFGALVVSSS